MASSVREYADETVEETTDAGECPECDGQIVADGSEDVCQDCGLIADVDRIDHGPEWRAFNHNEERERRRTGAPRVETLHDHGLGSQIGVNEEDGGMGRLRMWHKRFEVRSGKEQNLRDAFGQINRVTCALDLPDVVGERACAHFREAHDDGAFFGRCLDAGVGACVFIAARECRLGISLADIRGAIQDGHMDPYRMLQRLQRELNVELPPPRPEDSLPRVAGRLEIDDETQAEAREIVETFVDNRSLSGLDPRGIVAMAIYVASGRTWGQQLTQETIVEEANVSLMTLRERLRDFEEVSE